MKYKVLNTHQDKIKKRGGGSIDLYKLSKPLHLSQQPTTSMKHFSSSEPNSSSAIQ